MKRVLSIIFGLVLIGCLTGCQSTKVETPVVEAPVVEPHVHPATLHLELSGGLSKTGPFELGLGEKLKLDVINKDFSIEAFYEGAYEKTWGEGVAAGLCKSVDIEYYIYDDDDEILKITKYLNKPLSEGVINWYKSGNGWAIYEDGNLVTYLFLRTRVNDPTFYKYESAKKQEAFLESLRETLYKN